MSSKQRRASSRPAFFPTTDPIFPATGCWEINASVGEERLTFVVLAVRSDDNGIAPPE